MRQHILVIEDDLSIADVVQAILEYEGYAVDVSQNGDIVETVLKQKDATPSVILMDIYLSGDDGRELTKKLKGSLATKHIPVVIMSASFNAGRDAKTVGADDFLEKPFTIESLIGKVKRYVN
jgi:CheY-like chemotaxis protein